MVARFSDRVLRFQDGIIRPVRVFRSEEATCRENAVVFFFVVNWLAEIDRAFAELDAER